MRIGIMTRLLVVAAGTGGHVYPALAVAQRLRSLGVDVSWLGTAVGIESRLVPAAGFPFHVSKVAGLRGKGPARWLAAPLLLLRSALRAIAVLARVRPHVVLGMGGYGAGPGGLMARAQPASWKRFPRPLHPADMQSIPEIRCGRRWPAARRRRRGSRIAGAVSECW